MSRNVVKFVGKTMLKSIALAGTVACISTISAQASTLAGQFGGTISTPTGQTGSTFEHIGGETNALNWGTSSGASTTVVDGDSSKLSIDTFDFNYTAAVGEHLLGTITWDNQSNWHAGGTWDSVLTLNLAFDTDTGGSTVRSIPLTFSVYNSTDVDFDTNVNEQLGNNPDEISGFSLGENAFGLPIYLGDSLGITNIALRLDDAGSAGTVDNGYTFDGSAAGSRYDAITGLWESREGGVSTIGVYATVAAVPLPAGLLLMFSGLGSFFVLNRRKVQLA
ncbi:MAG: VPLPA-CTERM sorting domain-containing protein [Roseobacter sp.]